MYTLKLNARLSLNVLFDWNTLWWPRLEFTYYLGHENVDLPSEHTCQYCLVQSPTYEPYLTEFEYFVSQLQFQTRTMQSMWFVQQLNLSVTKYPFFWSSSLSSSGFEAFFYMSNITSRYQFGRYFPIYTDEALLVIYWLTRQLQTRDPLRSFASLMTVSRYRWLRFQGVSL